MIIGGNGYNHAIMSRPEFALRLVEILASWPVVTLAIILFIRRQLFEVLQVFLRIVALRLQRLKGGGLEVELGDLIQPVIQPALPADVLKDPTGSVEASRPVWQEWASHIQRAEHQFLYWLADRPDRAATGLEIVNEFMREVLQAQRVFISRADFSLIRDKLLRAELLDYREGGIGNSLILNERGMQRVRELRGRV